MTVRRTVQRCRWAEPTLFLDDPKWMEAEAYPWSCRADGDPELVEDTERCNTCGRWVARDARAQDVCRCTELKR